MVTPMAANQPSPVEVIIDVVADVNRASPGSRRQARRRPTTRTWRTRSSEFCLDPASGLEQVYTVDSAKRRCGGTSPAARRVGSQGLAAGLAFLVARLGCAARRACTSPTAACGRWAARARSSPAPTISGRSGTTRRASPMRARRISLDFTYMQLLGELHPRPPHRRRRGDAPRREVADGHRLDAVPAAPDPRRVASPSAHAKS